MNRWSNIRARMELSICITRDVHKRVDEAIPIPDDPNDLAANNVDYMDTLADIECRLIPEVDCNMT